MEHGFDIGQLVERKGDRMKCFIESASEQTVKVSLDGTRDVYLSIPMTEFIDRKWIVKRVNEQVNVNVSPKLNALFCHELQVARYRSMIQLEVYNLTINHEESVQHVQICVKPTRGVMVTKAFPKGKLTLVPTTLKVMTKAGDAPKSAVVVETPFTDAVFRLSNMPLPKSADADIAVPFWFLGKGEEDKQNMDIVIIKGPGGLNVPVARNTKQLKVGEMLYLPKAEESSGSSAHVVDSAPKKRARKSS